MNRRSAFASSETPAVVLIAALIGGALTLAIGRAKGEQNWTLLAIFAGLFLMMLFRLCGIDAINAALKRRENKHRNYKP